MDSICVADFEKQAKNLLSDAVYSYIQSGAQSEVTLARNRRIFDEIFFLPKVLNNIDNCTTECSLLGQSYAMPVIIAPMAFHCLVHNEGEIATLAAANKNKVGMAVSTMSSTSLEDIAKKNKSGSLFFQLYLYSSVEITKSLVFKAEKLGYKAIIITVDVPVMGRRYADMRHQLHLPQELIAENIPEDIAIELQKKHASSSIKEFTDKYFKKSTTLDDIVFIKSLTKLPIIVKGILDPVEARKLAEAGIDGIIISNHGGRQLDGTPTSIEMLPIISEHVPDNFYLFIDGGITRGTDILKAVALGADAVLIGRPIIWGLACEGANGVSRVLEILQQELIESMMLCGLRDITTLRKYNIVLQNKLLYIKE